MVLHNSNSNKYQIIPYDREKALDYAHLWAYKRNPDYYNFDVLGGDCTNFVSQVLFAGSDIMNFTPIFGWFFKSLDYRSPSWTGVDFLYNFLTTNKQEGPFGKSVAINQVTPGDIVQISFNKYGAYSHSLIIVETSKPAALETTLICAHTFDMDYKPLTFYQWERIRFISIDGIRKGQ